MVPGWFRRSGQALLVVAATCYSLKDVRDAVCRALCKRDGYQQGRQSTKPDQCECFDVKDVDEGPISLGVREYSPGEKSETQTPHRYPFFSSEDD